MHLLLAVLTVMGPIAFAILLGYLAGRIGIVKPEANEAMSTLALKFCLPALLFSSTATMQLSELTAWRLILGLMAGVLLIYFAGFLAGKLVFRRTIPECAMQALNAGASDLSSIGVPLLLAVFGKTAVLIIVVGNAFASFVIIPLTLVLLGSGTSSGSASRGTVIRNALLNAVRSPLVLAPAVGICFALMHIKLPEFVAKSCSLMGEALPAVSLFAMGLFFVGRTFNLSPAVFLNVGLKLLIEPLAMVGCAILFQVEGLQRREMILLGALPTATLAAIFAMQFTTYEDETEASVLLSAVASLATITLCVVLTRNLR